MSSPRFVDNGSGITGLPAAAGLANLAQRAERYWAAR